MPGSHGTICDRHIYISSPVPSTGRLRWHKGPCAHRGEMCSPRFRYVTDSLAHWQIPHTLLSAAVSFSIRYICHVPIQTSLISLFVPTHCTLRSNSYDNCITHVRSVYVCLASRVVKAIVYGMVKDICHGFESYQNLVIYFPWLFSSSLNTFVRPLMLTKLNLTSNVTRDWLEVMPY
jgi:hypothetical protein